MSEAAQDTEKKEDVKQINGETTDGQEKKDTVDGGDQTQKNNSKLYNNQQSYVSVFQTQKNRVNIEKECQSIQNRIAKLEHETSSLTKQINETEIKADKIYENKKRFASKIAQRKRDQIEVEEIPFTAPKGQLQMLKCKLNQQENVERKQKNTVELKTHLANDFLRKSKDDQMQLHFRQHVVSKARDQQQESKSRIEVKRAKKILKVQHDQAEKIAYEEYQIGKVQEQLKKLETYEKKLLDTLQNTQTQLKVTQDRQEFAQTKGASEFEAKYNTAKLNQPGLSSTQLTNTGQMETSK